MYYFPQDKANIQKMCLNQNWSCGSTTPQESALPFSHADSLGPVLLFFLSYLTIQNGSIDNFNKVLLI
jgi:hypothetical protein